MNIVGISGLAGSGKDTVADLLLQKDGFIKISLADPIKRFARELWGFSIEQLWGSSEHRNEQDLRYLCNGEYLTPRKVLQQIGTECGRSLDFDVWIRYAIQMSQKALSEQGKWSYSKEIGLELYDKTKHINCPEIIKGIIISDCRFVNELKYIKQSGGKLIRVIRPGAGLQGEFGSHRSETELVSIPDSEFDIIINNIGTLEDLKNIVNQINV
ncbi:MAG: hypothetical protein WC942_01195 [Clostridia bacterium]|jgi:hypothetical protein